LHDHAILTFANTALSSNPPTSGTFLFIVYARWNTDLTTAGDSLIFLTIPLLCHIGMEDVRTRRGSRPARSRDLPNQLPDRGNAHDDRRFVRHEIAIAVPHALVCQRLGGSVCYGSATKVKGHFDEELEDVSERKEGEEDVGREEFPKEECLGSGDLIDT
jgi:hypothetical protein